MGKHHLIISGTGRAGTTFLVQLLTVLKLDTGFASPESLPVCDAGMEWNIRDPAAPYIVKSPWLCDSLDRLVTAGEVVIDHAIVPVRDLHSAAESRRDVMRRAGPGARAGEVPGGLWHTDRPELQEVVLALQLYKLIHALARHDIPLTLLSFPRLLHDPGWLYERLAFMLGDIGRESFVAAHASVARPELVHDFAVDRACAT